MLALGEQTRKARAARSTDGIADGTMAKMVPEVRSVFGVVFNWVVDHALRGNGGALQLQADAASELKAGRPRLLEFVRKHRNDLADQLDFVWELVDAPKRLERAVVSRKELLFRAATATSDARLYGKQCANGDCQCAKVYESILEFQGVCSEEFRHKLFLTLTAGREKGNAMMIVGGRDSGKTTITQPAAKIFKTMPTPQSDSFCPLQNIRGHELFLWQDLRYAPGHPQKDEQGLRVDEGTWNRLLEGLPTLVGVAKTDGGRSDFVYDEDAAFLFTGPFELTAWRNGRPDARETEQLATRMRYIQFSRPAPPRDGRTLKPCAFCWSRWLLVGELCWNKACGLPLDDFMSNVSNAWLDSTAPVPKRAKAEPPNHADEVSAPSSAAPAVKRLKVEVLAVGGVASHPEAAPIHPASSSAPEMQPPRALAIGGTTGADLFQQLSSLIEWHAAGHLSKSELEVAKRSLGLS